MGPRVAAGRDLVLASRQRAVLPPGRRQLGRSELASLQPERRQLLRRGGRTKVRKCVAYVGRHWRGK